MNNSYSNAGVDLTNGDLASKILYQASKKSWESRKGIFGDIITPKEDFSGVRCIDISALPQGTYMGIGFDGIGTKVEVAERMNKYDTLAYDLLAMVCDDAVIRGAVPVLAGSVLDVNRLSKDGISYIDKIEELASGYESAARVANVSIMNGELAELGDKIGGYGDFCLSWGAEVTWFLNKEKMITGDKIEKGQKIIALQEKGFRSNGFSLVRKILTDKYGDMWHEELFNGEKIGDLMLLPSQIYSRAMVDMFGGLWDEKRVEITGAAHITGGGIPSKLGRILKNSQYGAVLDNLFEPTEIVKHIQKIGGVEDLEAYRAWCMGQGMLIISNDSEDIIKISKEHGIFAKVVGEITTNDRIIIKSKGVSSKDNYLEYQIEK